MGVFGEVFKKGWKEPGDFDYAGRWQWRSSDSVPPEPGADVAVRIGIRFILIDSGLKLDLAIAPSGYPAPNAFGVETSGDVIVAFVKSAF